MKNSMHWLGWFESARHWIEPIKAKCGTGLSTYRVMSGAVLTTFVVLYLIFR